MKGKKRIAIVGAGAAGMAAAYELRRRGYSDITIFDRRPRVGGKCLTQFIGGRPYEIGALIVANSYDNVLELLREANLGIEPLDPIRVIDIEAPGSAARLSPAARARMLLDLARLAADCLRCRRKLARQGFSGWEDTDRACCTFDEWLHRCRLTSARSLVAP